MPATSIYGIAIKYTMPSLIPFAVVCPSSLSNTARHIAHCALPFRKKRKEKRKKIILCFKTKNLKNGASILIMAFPFTHTYQVFKTLQDRKRSGYSLQVLAYPITIGTRCGLSTAIPNAPTS
tara:strand:- start:538 stop:903 length:366 start_codon:yes stop_codon:yes gene_type:complete